MILLTYEQKAECDDVRRRLLIYIEDHPINFTEMARRVGLTKSVLTKFKNNYQPYIAPKNYAKIDKFLENLYY